MGGGLSPIRPPKMKGWTALCTIMPMCWGSKDRISGCGLSNGSSTLVLAPFCAGLVFS